MDKLSLLFGSQQQERSAFFIEADRRYLEKRAGSYHPKVMEYIKTAQPLPNLVQVLLTALGASEYWPQNSNGDFWPENMLSPERDDFGYKTFETNANYFLHHVNSNPLLAKGKVIRSIWNGGARRVELIVGIDIDKDPEGIAAVDRGEQLSFSMGSRVPFDLCRICMNRARNRSEYCDHARYMMNQIDPVTGRLVGVTNIRPKFFDISRVLIPADKTAFMWLKIASAANPFHGVPSAVLAEGLAAGKDLLKTATEYRDAFPFRTGIKYSFQNKRGAVDKTSDIIKRVPANIKPQFVEKLDAVVPRVVAKLEANSPALDARAIEAMAGVPLADIISTFLGLAMVPKPDELGALFVGREPLDAAQTFGPEGFDAGVARHLMPLLPERSYFRPQLTRRLVVLAKRRRLGDHLKEATAVAAADLIPATEKTLRVARETAPPVNPTTVAALLAATYALFGPHATGAARGIGQLLSAHPFLALSLGAGTMRALQALRGQSVIGSYDLDDPTRGFYNYDWQSRFARQQARPVTVIKTGTATYDTQLAKKLLFGIPAIYLGAAATQMRHEANPGKSQGPLAEVLRRHPDLLSMGLIGEHIAGKPVSRHVESVIESGKRLFKHAAIDDLEFISALPSPEWELVSDIAILSAGLELVAKP